MLVFLVTIKYNKVNLQMNRTTLIVAIVFMEMHVIIRSCTSAMKLL